MQRIYKYNITNSVKTEIFEILPNKNGCLNMVTKERVETNLIISYLL